MGDSLWTAMRGPSPSTTDFPQSGRSHPERLVKGGMCLRFIGHIERHRLLVPELIENKAEHADFRQSSLPVPARWRE
jgi:hypothetical protein